MTIRQLWVRLKVVLGDRDSALCRAIAVDQAEAEEAAQVSAIDDALDNIRKGG